MFEDSLGKFERMSASNIIWCVFFISHVKYNVHIVIKYRMFLLKYNLEIFYTTNGVPPHSAYAVRSFALVVNVYYTLYGINR